MKEFVGNSFDPSEKKIVDSTAPLLRGEELRKLRKEAGLVQKDLAAKVGVNQTFISKLELYGIGSEAVARNIQQYIERILSEQKGNEFAQSTEKPTFIPEQKDKQLILQEIDARYKALKKEKEEALQEFSTLLGINPPIVDKFKTSQTVNLSTLRKLAGSLDGIINFHNNDGTSQRNSTDI